MDTQRIEWDELEEGQRNCLMWPDFLLWDEPRTVEIHRKDTDASLGLVTITVQVSFYGQASDMNITGRLPSDKLKPNLPGPVCLIMPHNSLV
jgi:hypothetical protein